MPTGQCGREQGKKEDVKEEPKGKNQDNLDTIPMPSHPTTYNDYEMGNGPQLCSSFLHHLNHLEKVLVFLFAHPNRAIDFRLHSKTGTTRSHLTFFSGTPHHLSVLDLLNLPLSSFRCPNFLHSPPQPTAPAQRRCAFG